MNAREEVVQAATARAAALASGDGARLGALLHEDFRWTSHTGEQFDLHAYIEKNTGRTTVWRSQELRDPEVIVVDEVAVLRCTVRDEIRDVDGTKTYRMPMTQVWVRSDGAWKCLAGHAGPREPHRRRYRTPDPTGTRTDHGVST